MSSSIIFEVDTHCYRELVQIMLWFDHWYSSKKATNKKTCTSAVSYLYNYSLSKNVRNGWISSAQNRTPAYLVSMLLKRVVDTSKHYFEIIIYDRTRHSNTVQHPLYDALSRTVYDHCRFSTIFDHSRQPTTIHDSLRQIPTVYDHSRQSTTNPDRLRPSTTVYDHWRHAFSGIPSLALRHLVTYPWHLGEIFFTFWI